MAYFGVYGVYNPYLGMTKKNDEKKYGVGIFFWSLKRVTLGVGVGVGVVYLNVVCVIPQCFLK